MRKVICVKCGETFETLRKNGTHCPSCIQARYEGRATRGDLNCSSCDTVIPRKRGRPQKYCETCRAKPVKTCSLCGETTEVHGGKLRHNPYCADCVRNRLTDVRRDGGLRRAYGLSLVDYLGRLESQGGRCAACERGIRARWETRSMRETACVDHDHGTGKVRGLLCGNCNTGVGLLGDNLEGVLKAVRYLKGVDKHTYEGESG